MRRLLAVALLMLPELALAQGASIPRDQGVLVVSAAPTGSCTTPNQIRKVASTGAEYWCSGGTWMALPVSVASGSSGALQSSNGSGGLADSGVTATAGALTAKQYNGIRYANQYATGGAGTTVSPWTGWETAITTLPSTGGSVVFPKGYYYTSSPVVIPYDGVSISGEVNVNRGGVNNNGSVVHASGTWSGDAVFKGTGINGVTIRDLKITGTGTTSANAILADGGNRWTIENVFTDQFTGPCVYLKTDGGSNVTGKLSNIWSENCVKGTSLAAKTGAIQVEWTDTYIDSVTGSTSSSDYSESGKRVGILLAGSFNFMVNSVGHLSEDGIALTGTFNRVSNSRADLNRGNGFVVTGGSNAISNSLSMNNSQQTDNAYDGFYVATGTNNTLTGNTNAYNLTNKVRYAFNDASGSQANVWIGNYSPASNHGTAEYSNTSVGRWFGPSTATGFAGELRGSLKVGDPNSSTEYARLTFPGSAAVANFGFSKSNLSWAFDYDGTLNYSADPFVTSTSFAAQSFVLKPSAAYNGNRVTVTAATPSAAQTATFPDASGTVVLANGSPANKVKYFDRDTDGDGTTDYREVGDQSGDGSLTITDIQTALDTLCDGNSDGTQNTKQFDVTGDGTLDTVNTCGTLVVLPGKYSATSPSYAGLTVKWDNVTILGYGALIDYQVPWSKILPRWGGSNTTYNGVLIAHTNQSTPIENVVFKGFHVYGSRSMLRSCIDPNQDGSTADKVAAANCLADSDGDGTNNNQGSQNDIVIVNPRGVVVADNIVEGAYRQGLSVSSGNHDATPETAGAVIENNEWRGEFGEHCAEMDAPNIRIAKNKFSGCNGIVQAGAGSGTQAYTGNRAVEIYSPASALGRFLNGIVVDGNTFEQVQDGVSFIADPGASGTLDGLVVSNNIFRGTLRYGVSLDTPANVTLQNITITGNVYSTPVVGADLYQLPVGTGRGGLIGVNTTSGKLDRVNISGNTVTLNARGTNSAARTLTNDYAISVVAPSSNGQVINITNNNITMFPDWYNTALDAAIFASGYGVRIDGNTIHMINDTTIDWAGDGTMKDAPGIGIVASALNHSNVENNTILFDNTATPAVDFGCISLTGGGSRSTFSRNTCIARKSAWGLWLGSGTYAHEVVADNFMTTTTTAGADTLAGFFWDNGNTGANPFLLRNNVMVGPTGGGSYLNVAASNNITFEGNSCLFCTSTPQDADEAAGRGWGHLVDGGNDGLDAYTLFTLNAKTHMKHGTGSVASATSISVDGSGDVVTITGSTTINTITTCNAQSAGRPLTILCGSATAAFGDLVGNVDLSAAFTCTANDTISFLCDGTNWRETARAAN